MLRASGLPDFATTPDFESKMIEEIRGKFREHSENIARIFLESPEIRGKLPPDPGPASAGAGAEAGIIAISQFSLNFLSIISQFSLNFLPIFSQFSVEPSHTN